MRADRDEGPSTARGYATTALRECNGEEEEARRRLDEMTGTDPACHDAVLAWAIHELIRERARHQWTAAREERFDAPTNRKQDHGPRLNAVGEIYAANILKMPIYGMPLGIMTAADLDAAIERYVSVAHVHMKMARFLKKVRDGLGEAKRVEDRFGHDELVQLRRLAETREGPG